MLEEYFAATDPVPGGSGAVRLKKPLVDGSRGVDGYHASVAAAVREGGEPAQDGAEGEGRAAWAPTTLQMLREMQASFAAARDWDQFHTPRNLLIALVGEVGEVGEIFQWKGEVERGLPQFSAEEKAHVAEELSDVRLTDPHQHPKNPSPALVLLVCCLLRLLGAQVLLYLVRLADVCDVDLGAAVLAKLEKNGAKYPADLVRGSSAKYTEYKNAARGS